MADTTAVQEGIPELPATDPGTSLPEGGTESSFEQDMADVLGDDFPELFPERAKSEEAPTEPEVAAPVAPAVAPANPPAREGQPQEPPAAAAPAPAPAQPEQPAPAPAPAPAPEQPAPTPEQEAQWREHVAQVREQVRTGIESRYTLPQESEELGFTPEQQKYLAKLGSHFVMDTYDSVLQTVMAQLPHVMSGFQQQQTVQQTEEQAFFQQWPVLKEPQYRETITRIAQTYRRLNPRVPVDKMRAEVGAQAVIALGLMDKVAPAAQPSANPAPRPFVPAATGAAQRAVQPQGENPFAALAREFEEL